MKKIIILGTTANSMMGFRLPLIKKLISKNILVYCLANDFSPTQISQLKSMGAIPISYPVNRTGFNPIQDIANTYKLYKIIKTLNVDTLLAYFVKPVVYGTLAAYIAGIKKRYAMLEGLGFFFTEQPNKNNIKTSIIKLIQTFLYKTSLPLTSGVILLNNDDKRDLIQKYNIKINKILIIPGIGLNLSDYPYNPLKKHRKPLSFLFIGRLLKEKGINEFIAAARYIKSQYPEVHFKVAGSIDPSNPGSISQQEFNELKQLNIIEFLGQVNNIATVISESDVFVLPSYREGMPRSTQEAMAVGRAVITTNAPGCNESIINLEHGFIINKWSTSELIDKIIYFINHPHATVTMGEKAHLHAIKHYNCDNTNQQIFSFLNEEQVTNNYDIKTLN